MDKAKRTATDMALVYQDISKREYTDARKARLDSYRYISCLAQCHAAIFSKAARRAMGLTDSICNQ